MSLQPRTVGCRLSELSEFGQILGDARCEVSGVRHDSRDVVQGDAFVAIRGQHRDGERHVPEAVARGAVAVVSERRLQGVDNQLLVEDARRSLPLIAHRVYGEPTRELNVVGITGTNGKTTTAHLIEQALTHTGRRPALLGTVMFRGPGLDEPAGHTTPEGDVIARLSRQTLDEGATDLVMEVSSHALALHRADGIHYDVACFTNLSRDHLDFHGSLDAYGKAKARLFLDLRPKRSVVMIRPGFGAELADRIEQSGGQVLRCIVDPSIPSSGPCFRVASAECTRHGIAAEIETPDGLHRLESLLIGAHNLENLLVALGALWLSEVPLDAALVGLAAATGAPGRLERVSDPRDVAVLVDYAHTPDALAHVLDSLRPLTPGRLICLFGCGGDRDPGKRPMMGRVAGERADLTVLTSDNPRSESPSAIVADIESGLRGAKPIGDVADEPSYVVEVDRIRAIRVALEAAKAGDTVLIAGKGHETYQRVGEQSLPLDDRVEARQAIAAIAGGT